MGRSRCDQPLRRPPPGPCAPDEVLPLLFRDAASQPREYLRDRFQVHETSRSVPCAPYVSSSSNRRWFWPSSKTIRACSKAAAAFLCTSGVQQKTVTPDSPGADTDCGRREVGCFASSSSIHVAICFLCFPPQSSSDDESRARPDATGLAARKLTISRSRAGVSCFSGHGANGSENRAWKNRSMLSRYPPKVSLMLPASPRMSFAYAA